VIYTPQFSVQQLHRNSSMKFPKKDAWQSVVKCKVHSR
jgi:hypothetical protein